MAKSKKTNPLEDYKSMNVEALNDHVGELTDQLKKLEFSHAINPIENPMRIRATRRMIARLKTELWSRTEVTE